jgi:hypothetical protein
MEFGVRWGQNMALFTSFRNIYEPYNVSRKIIGFDTFAGFPSISEQDGVAETVQVGASLIRRKVDCRLIDAGPILQNAIVGEFIYASNIDCHFNDAGVNALYRIVDEIVGSTAGN